MFKTLYREYLLIIYKRIHITNNNKRFLKFLLKKTIMTGNEKCFFFKCLHFLSLDFI